eukprot:344896-Ditylum_brightwellii.AAC.1
MDDSVEYIYCGTSDKPATFRLTASIHNLSVGTHSRYKIDNSKIMSAGQVVPLCVSISGLTKAELLSSKCPSGLRHKKINGLCVGRNSMTPMEGQPLHAGYLLLLRDDKDSEQDKK